MVIYDSAEKYIETATSLKGKVVKINAIISALLTTALQSASTDNITEYSLNDGQVQIKTVYNGTAAVMKSIQDFEMLKTYYMNKINGRAFRLVDSKNFTGGRNGR